MEHWNTGMMGYWALRRQISPQHSILPLFQHPATLRAAWIESSRGPQSSLGFNDDLDRILGLRYQLKAFTRF
jgi:hypothetical protein